jgi:hypothetical protein
MLRSELTGRLQGASSIEEKKTVLNVFKDHHLFLIDAAHLVQPGTLMDFFVRPDRPGGYRD